MYFYHRLNLYLTELCILLYVGNGKEGHSGSGALSKQLGPSDFKSSIRFHSNVCKCLHNCFHLRMGDDRKKNMHGTWKSNSSSCSKAIWAITDGVKFINLLAIIVYLFRRLGHLYARAGPTVWHLPQLWNQKRNARKMPGGEGWAALELIEP